MLGEPTNDLDTDMLTALEDLLDSWPGTLLVISHDRYFVERVTDQQYAVLGGKLRHLPGGVDEYLRLGAEPGRGSARTTVAGTPAPRPTATGADLRAAQKELASVERRMSKLSTRITDARAALEGHDPSDYVGLGNQARELDGLEAELASLEEQWLTLGTSLENNAAF